MTTPNNGGAATRTVKYDEGVLGMWSMTCAECPLIPHAAALGQNPPECAGGIATNMQGPVPLKTCKHLVPNSYANSEDGGITIGCTYAEPSP